MARLCSKGQIKMSDAELKSQEDKKEIEVDEEEFKRRNAEMILSDLITPDNIYVDLALCKDYNIGVLLSFLSEWKKTSQEKNCSALYNHILASLPKYQNRKFDDIPHYFPEFQITQDQFNERLKDPMWARFILHNATITPYIESLIAQIAVNLNHSAVKGKKDEITFIINTYPLRLQPQDHYIIGMYFAQTLKVRASVVYMDMTSLKLEDVVTFDEIYTYHFVDLFSNESVRKGYSELKFVTKRLFVPKLFGNRYDPKMDTESEELKVKTHCDILTLFKFFPVNRCSAISPVDGSQNSKKE